MCSNNRLRRVLVAGFAAIVVLSAADIYADLMVDLRVDAVSGGLDMESSTAVCLYGPGTITVGIYAIPGYSMTSQSYTATTSSISAVMGSIEQLRWTGIAIDRVVGINVTPFADATTAQPGVQSTKSDGSKCLGVFPLNGDWQFQSDTSGYFRASAGEDVFSPYMNGNNGVEIGTATFHTTSNWEQQVTDGILRWIPYGPGIPNGNPSSLYSPDGDPGNGALFEENGEIMYDSDPITGAPYEFGGSAITIGIFVPEPATLALLVVSAISLLAYSSNGGRVRFEGLISN
jgi:hypothetical protein